MGKLRRREGRRHRCLPGKDWPDRRSLSVGPTGLVGQPNGRLALIEGTIVPAKAGEVSGGTRFDRRIPAGKPTEWRKPLLLFGRGRPARWHRRYHDGGLTGRLSADDADPAGCRSGRIRDRTLRFVLLVL
jgi:hypothetical protein